VRLTSRRSAAAVTVVVSAGLLLSGGPVPSASAATGATASVLHPGSAPTQVALERHRWPGHPGRRLVHYQVRPGDTATGLAVRFHAWTDELRALNRLGPAGELYVGERIRIPVVVAAARKAARDRSRAGSPRPERVQESRPERRSQARRHPWRRAEASRAEVRRTIVAKARRLGVNPHLALAVAWQESGWQQRRTSSAGAVGVMQVMPDTGTWMSLYAGRRLNIYGMRDNVTAGVLLLKVLRGETDRRRAIAAYYQGLGAVREHGLYPSTVQYHRSVAALHRRIARGWNPA